MRAFSPLIVILQATLIILGMCSTNANAALGDRHTLNAMQTIEICGDPHSVTMDVLSPVGGTGTFPAILMVHGGGWSAGSRTEYHALMQELAPYGIVTLSMDYRLVPQSRFPAQIEDVKCALRWMKAHAVELHIDPNRIAAIGGSAGGHLVALAGTSIGLWDQYGGNTDQSSRVRCMVLHGAPTDLEYAWQTADLQTARGVAGRNMLRALLGVDYEVNPYWYRQASPYFYIGSQTPPTLLIHGALDDIVPVNQSERFVAKLQTFGIIHDAILVPDGDHGGFGTNSQKVSERFQHFLYECLK